MNKEHGIYSLDATFRCVCGALPYNQKEQPDGKVGLTRYRKSKYGCDCGYSVTCCGCGRVGERGRTQTDAALKWQGHLYKYGPLKEEQ